MATVVCEKKNGAAWIYLNRPTKLNSFTPESYALLRDTIRGAESDDGVDIIVITGSGRAFATGADLQALEQAISSDDPAAIYSFGNHFPFDAVRDCTKVTIAAVNGLCLGAGLIIAALCDLIVASPSASFGIPEGRVGVADPFAPVALFTKIPTTQLKLLALTGASISAQQAREIGLVTQVVEGEGEAQLVGAVDDLIAAIRRTTPTARRYYKQYIDDLLPRARAKDAYPPLLSEEGHAALAEFLARQRDRSVH